MTASHSAAVWSPKGPTTTSGASSSRRSRSKAVASQSKHITASWTHAGQGELLSSLIRTQNSSTCVALLWDSIAHQEDAVAAGLHHHARQCQALATLDLQKQDPAETLVKRSFDPPLPIPIAPLPVEPSAMNTRPTRSRSEG